MGPCGGVKAYVKLPELALYLDLLSYSIRQQWRVPL